MRRVQVINGSGERIEPAWSEFVKVMHSKSAGDYPGEVFFHDSTERATKLPLASLPTTRPAILVRARISSVAQLR